MKNTAFIALAALAVFAAGCATSGSTATSTANTPMTLEEALQKSAETRQKLIDAKKQYEVAKTAAEAGESVSAALAKQAIQNKVDDAKKQIEDEKNAWKEVLGK